jgi:RNA polymerase sigma factor (sigma-70 family)
MIAISPEMLKLCQEGDRRAQHDLYKACFQTLMGVCMRYKKDQSEAASSLNIGFLKVVTNLEKYKPEAPFEAWIRRIMINTLVDEFRKSKREKEIIEHVDFSTAPPNLSYGKDLNEGALLMDAEEIEAIIKLLPPVTQKVFNLSVVDGYSHDEISEMLGMSAGTSKWHLSFGRARLREIIIQKKTVPKVI